MCQDSANVEFPFCVSRDWGDGRQSQVGDFGPSDRRTVGRDGGRKVGGTTGDTS